MLRQRNFWVYSIACFVVWGILIAVTAAKASGDALHNIVLVFAGWSLCWVSATIARSVYPPPKRWLREAGSTVQ